MEENIYPIYFISFSFVLTIISTIIDNSIISLILIKKNISPSILYISSLFSSLILNLSSMIIGRIINFFLNIDIIKNFFIIVVFAIYGFFSLILSCFPIKAQNEKYNLIKEIMSQSSGEESEGFKLDIISKKYKNEMEIELDNLNNEESLNDKINLNETNNQVEEESDFNSIIINFFNCLYYLILIDMGDKIQIFNISLAMKYEKWIYFLIGNFFANIIINTISILYGEYMIEKKISKIFIILESIVYLGIAGYYIYLLFK